LGPNQGQIIFINVFTGSGLELGHERCLGLAVRQDEKVSHLRCVQSFPKLDLVSRPGSDYYDRNIGFLCCFDCFVESRLVVAPSLTSLGVVDLGFVADCSFDTVEWSDAAVLTLVDNVVAVL
jgi:hypothetical protein